MFDETLHPKFITPLPVAAAVGGAYGLRLGAATPRQIAGRKTFVSERRSVAVGTIIADRRARIRTSSTTASGSYLGHSGFSGEIFSDFFRVEGAADGGLVVFCEYSAFLAAINLLAVGRIYGSWLVAASTPIS